MERIKAPSSVSFDPPPLTEERAKEIAEELGQISNGEESFLVLLIELVCGVAPSQVMDDDLDRRNAADTFAAYLFGFTRHFDDCLEDFRRVIVDPKRRARYLDQLADSTHDIRRTSQ